MQPPELERAIIFRANAELFAQKPTMRIVEIVFFGERYGSAP